MPWRRFDPYKLDREKLRRQKAIETLERRKKYGFGGVRPMIAPEAKLKAQRKRNVSMRAKRIPITLPLVALALLAVIVPQRPAEACHIYSVWHYPTPQHCGGFYAHKRPIRIFSVHRNLSVVANVHLVHDHTLDFPLPDLRGDWQIALDTPVALELYQGMQRQKAIKQLTGE